MDIDLDFESNNLNDRIDYLLDLWKNQDPSEKIRVDFDELRLKVKQRIESLVETILKLEKTYLNHVSKIELEFRNKYQSVKHDIEKLENYKIDNSNNVDIDDFFVENLSDNIKKLCHNKVDFVPNKKPSIPFSLVGKFTYFSNNQYDDKNINVFGADSGEILNEDHEERNFKFNTQALFTRAHTMCAGNSRFTGALHIPEYKYNKYSQCANEFALFAVSNKNCVKLMALPDGRILRTYTQLPHAEVRTIEALKEPRAMCWNHDKSLIVLCDSGNNRLLVLRPKFRKGTFYFYLDLEFVFEVTRPNLELTNFQYPAAVCCNYTNGDIYVCDTFNSRIIGLTKDLSTVVRVISGGLNNPFGICFSNDRLYIADTYNHRVLVVSTIDGQRERIIPVDKGEEKDDVSDDENEDDNESLDCRIVKKKKVSSSSSDDDDDDDTSEGSSYSSANSETSSLQAIKNSKLHGRFKRPYGVYVDNNNRLFVCDWYNTDTNSSEESIRLSGRIQVFDVDNECQLLSYSFAFNQLHLPNTMMVLKSGAMCVCNVRHLTVLTTSRVRRNFHRLKWNNTNNYSDDDD